MPDAPTRAVIASKAATSVCLRACSSFAKASPISPMASRASISWPARPAAPRGQVVGGKARDGPRRIAGGIAEDGRAAPLPRSNKASRRQPRMPEASSAPEGRAGTLPRSSPTTTAPARAASHPSGRPASPRAASGHKRAGAPPSRQPRRRDRSRGYGRSAPRLDSAIWQRSVSASGRNPCATSARGLKGASPQDCPSAENASGGAPSEAP